MWRVAASPAKCSTSIPTYILPQNHTTPFWLHPILQPESQNHTQPTPSPNNDAERCDEVEDEDGGEHSEEDDDEDGDLVDTEGCGDRNMMCEKASEHIHIIHDCADGLEYQLQFDNQ